MTTLLAANRRTVDAATLRDPVTQGGAGSLGRRADRCVQGVEGDSAAVPVLVRGSRSATRQGLASWTRAAATSYAASGKAPEAFSEAVNESNAIPSNPCQGQVVSSRPVSRVGALVLATLAGVCLAAGPSDAATAPVALGPPKVVATLGGAPGSGPGVARRADGRYQVIWADETADGWGIVTVPVGPDGGVIGSAISLASRPGRQGSPELVRAGEDLIATWVWGTPEVLTAFTPAALRLDSQGRPSGQELQTRHAAFCWPFRPANSCEQLLSLVTTGAESGAFTSLWTSVHYVGLSTSRRGGGTTFDAADSPTGSFAFSTSQSVLAARTDAEGETAFVVTDFVGDPPDPDDEFPPTVAVFLERRDAGGQPIGERLRLDPVVEPPPDDPTVGWRGAIGRAAAFDAAGNAFAIWSRRGELFGVHVGLDGETLSEELSLGADHGGRVVVAADGPASYLVVWSEPAPTGGYDVMARRVDTDGVACSSFRVNVEPAADPLPQVAAGPDGLMVVWKGAWGDGEAIFARGFTTQSCPAGESTLCLGGARFAVSVDWDTPQGSSGFGHAYPLTGDSGAFWFFDQANLELLVKVLDGRWINGHFWTFYGALSNVAYRLEVVDRETGCRQVYANPQGTMASVGDITSLPGDPAGSVAVHGNEQPEAAWFENDRPALASLLQTPPTRKSVGLCGASAQALCLGGRFAVEAMWSDFDGGSGVGYPHPLTSDSGAFWFFDQHNLELMVKVLDGAAINGNFWVFYGALSNVEFEITVTDTITGEVVRYRNPSGRFGSRADIEAFPSGGP